MYIDTSEISVFSSPAPVSVVVVVVGIFSSEQSQKNLCGASLGRGNESLY